VVIGHLELPVGRHPADVLQGQGDLPGLWTVFYRHFTKVPVENLQILLQIMHALIRLIRVIEFNLRLIQRRHQLLIQIRQLVLLPEVCGRDLIISNICDSEEREVPLGVARNGALFFDQILSLGLQLRISLSYIKSLFSYFLPSYNHQLDIKVERDSGFECNVNLHLGFSIDHALGVIKLEAVLETLVHDRQFFTLLRFLGHS
jgi:hypothetical protein